MFRIVLAYFLFVVHGFLKEIGVAFRQPNPFRFALEETKVTTGARAPFIISGQAHTGFLKDAHHSVFIDAGVAQGVDNFNI